MVGLYVFGGVIVVSFVALILLKSKWSRIARTLSSQGRERAFQSTTERRI